MPNMQILHLKKPSELLDKRDRLIENEGDCKSSDKILNKKR
jgi:hypothetical protein